MTANCRGVLCPSALTGARLLAPDGLDASGATFTDDQPGGPGQKPAQGRVNNQSYQCMQLECWTAGDLRRAEQTDERSDQQACDAVNKLGKASLGVRAERPKHEPNEQQGFDQSKDQIHGLDEPGGPGPATGIRIVAGRRRVSRGHLRRRSGIQRCGSACGWRLEDLGVLLHGSALLRRGDSAAGWCHEIVLPRRAGEQLMSKCMTMFA